MEPVTIELAILRDEVSERVGRCQNLAIAPSNASSFDSLRKDNNDYIRSVKAKVEGFREEVLKPYEERLAKILDELKPLEVANKALSNEILNAKKERFRKDMEAEYKDIVTADINGEIIPFERVFDPSWYGKTKTEARGLLAQALRKEKLKAERATYSYIVFADRARLEELELFMQTHGIDYQREE